jgi:[protein-PII] uridylyltransferase
MRALRDPEMLLRLFHFMAEHGLKLSTTTEYKVEQALPALAATPPRGAELWLYLQETLVQPHAADALRAMNALRLLALLLPELKGIEALVVRDFYHRYTVDEHSFLAIEHLHRLKESKSEWDQRFAGCWVNSNSRNCFTWRCCCTIPAKPCRRESR